MIANEVFVVLYLNFDQIHEGNHVCMGVLWSKQGRSLSIRFAYCTISCIILCLNEEKK